MCAMVLLMNLGRVIFAPLLEPIGDGFDASATEMGLLATCAWLGSASPPVGYLLTRVSRRTVIVVAGAILTVSPLLAATAPSLPVLWVSAFFMGASSGFYFIAAKPLLSDLFPTRIGSAVGLHGTASQIAAAGAPLVRDGRPPRERVAGRVLRHQRRGGVGDGRVRGHRADQHRAGRREREP